MKIAILAPITYPLPPVKYAPWEKVIDTLARGLTRAGIDITVFAAADSFSDYNIEPTVSESLNKIDSFKFQTEMLHITEAIKKIRNGKYDLVHNSINWYGLTALEASGMNYLTTLHGFEPDADKVFSHYRNSNYVSISNTLRSQSPDLNYVATIYNGVDFDLFKLIKKKSDYFFSSARICHDKGIHNAIELAQRTNIPLYLAGIIQEEEYFKMMVKPHIDNKNIIYLGNISQIEIFEYVSKAKAYLSLLEWPEPFGFSVAEAIACGTPVIATRQGSMQELIKDGISGILVDSVDEAVERINEIDLIDPKECRSFGASLFSIEKMVQAYIQVYETLIN